MLRRIQSMPIWIKYCDKFGASLPFLCLTYGVLPFWFPRTTTKRESLDCNRRFITTHLTTGCGFGRKYMGRGLLVLDKRRNAEMEEMEERFTGRISILTYFVVSTCVRITHCRVTMLSTPLWLLSITDSLRILQDISPGFVKQFVQFALQYWVSGFILSIFSENFCFFCMLRTWSTLISLAEEVRVGELGDGSMIHVRGILSSPTRQTVVVGCCPPNNTYYDPTGREIGHWSPRGRRLPVRLFHRRRLLWWWEVSIGGGRCGRIQASNGRQRWCSREKETRKSQTTTGVSHSALFLYFSTFLWDRLKVVALYA